MYFAVFLQQKRNIPCFIGFGFLLLPYSASFKSSCFVAYSLKSSVSFAFPLKKVPLLLHQSNKSSAFTGTQYLSFCISARISSLLVVEKFRIFCIKVPHLLDFAIVTKWFSISYGFTIIL